MKTIMILVVTAFLFAGCFEKPANPNIATAKVRLFKGSAIVNVEVDTTLHQLDDSLTFSYNSAYRYWRVSNEPQKDGFRRNALTFYNGVIEQWLTKKTKQAEAK
ncbi:MAG: hypothetical protein NTY12_04265 [Candidatus Falkowbacteria bacterium]|nr:hypothetical protein [Candidatus Falkowbacteria bacterium]